MKTYALIGHPLGHSFSASYFNNKFDVEGIDARYINIDIEEISVLPDIILSDPTICGLNVTIPHKVAVISYLDSLTESARQIGAVNTIRVERNADSVRLIGHNTDSPAFRLTLTPNIKPCQKAALLLGATGGAAKAIRYALQQIGVEVIGVSRSGANGCIRYEDITEQLMHRAKIIVNATPVGMYPLVDEKPEIPYDLITPQHLCYDLIYNPEQTEFLRIAAQQGAKTINGLPMLHMQADLAWKFWNADR